MTLYDQIQPVKETEEPLPIDSLPIHQKFIKVLQENGISSLLPIQSKAIEAGLLDGNDILAVSDTTSGKSLIGELAGIKAAMEGKTYIYLSPLVALANQKYHEYVEKFQEKRAQR